MTSLYYQNLFPGFTHDLTSYNFPVSADGNDKDRLELESAITQKRAKLKEQQQKSTVSDFWKDNSAYK